MVVSVQLYAGVVVDVSRIHAAAKEVFGVRIGDTGDRTARIGKDVGGLLVGNLPTMAFNTFGNARVGVALYISKLVTRRDERRDVIHHLSARPLAEERIPTHRGHIWVGIVEVEDLSSFVASVVLPPVRQGIRVRSRLLVGRDVHHHFPFASTPFRRVSEALGDARLRIIRHDKACEKVAACSKVLVSVQP